MTARFQPMVRPDFLDAYSEVGSELVARTAAAVDLDDQGRRRQPLANVEVTLDLPDCPRGSGVEVEAGVGLERPVVVQQSQRAGVPPRSRVTAFCEHVMEAIEEAGDLCGRLFMGEPRLGDELGDTGVFVVPTARRIVVVGQAVEELARHGDLDPKRGVGAAGRRRLADRPASCAGCDGRGRHSCNLHPSVRPGRFYGRREASTIRAATRRATRRACRACSSGSPRVQSGTRSAPVNPGRTALAATDRKPPAAPAW